MKNVTNQLPTEMLQSIQQFAQAKNIVVLAYNEADLSAEILQGWQANHLTNPQWTLQAIDKMTADSFGISVRTVQRIRSMAKVGERKNLTKQEI